MENIAELHSKEIERFAFQYGCINEQAAGVAEDTFRTFRSRLENVETEDAQTALFKTAIELLQGVELEVLPVDVFPFKEDAELHSKIIRLEIENRVPFILSVFHKLNTERIATITQCSAAEVEKRIRVAIESLGKALGETAEERLDKRFEFLGKSYNRLSLHFNIDNVIGIEMEGPVIETKVNVRIRNSRKVLIIAVFLGILLIGLTVGTYFNGDEWAHRSDERYIEKMKANFEKETDKKMKILGVNNAVFNTILFVDEANHQFTDLIQDLEKRVTADKELNRGYAEEEYANIIELMKLPSELADELFEAPLYDDIDKSMKFIKRYIEKMANVQYSLFEEIVPEVEKFTGSTVDENFNTEKFLENEADFDKRTSDAISALKSQELPLLPYFFHIGTAIDPEHSQFMESIRNSLHKLAGGYLLAYEKEPFTVNEKLVYSLDETVGFIEEMENTKQADKTNTEDMYTLEYMIPYLLEAIIMGETEEPLRNADGTIGEPHRKAWKQLASFGNDSTVSKLMKRIISEMEASGWKQSEFHSALDGFRVHDAYALASTGSLDDFELDQGMDFHEKYEVKTVNAMMLEGQTSELYNAFLVDYDRELLSSVHPLDILSLFYFASELENPLMMWHLIDEEERVTTPEDYVRDWKKETPLFLEADSVSFDPSLVMGTDEKPLVPIEFNQNGSESYDVWMTYAEDDVWQIQRIINRDGPQ